MTAPRRVLPQTVYLLTRRCAQRQFLLKPSATVNEVFLYVLAVAAKRFGVRVHAFCVLSNHFHAVVTDPEARLPAFEQFLNSLTARALNKYLGRWEAFWAPSSYSAVALVEPSDVIDKAAYVLANPVAAGLVHTARQWPGLWSAPEQIGGGPIRVKRPSHFFRPNGPMPESVELELTQPAVFSADEFRELLESGLAEREREAALDLQSRGRTFLGARRVLDQEPRSRPRPGEPRRSLNPSIAARDRWKRIEALSGLVGFRRAYRTARRALRQGVLDVVFPAGTYWLRIAHGVRCAPS